MHKIILVRHGEPDVKIAGKISGAEIPSFLDTYNNAPLNPSSEPSDRLRYLADNATVVCSTLPRSIASAQRCGVKPSIVDTCFCESIPPHFQSDLLKLSPKMWLFLSRMLWLCGFSRHGEALFQTKKRARHAAAILLQEAKNKDVILFGHGLFNIMIAKELKKRGYIGPAVPAREFWDYGIYRSV
jgi:broad specificity phosphatase PhoE